MYAARSTIKRRSLRLRNGGREIVFCDPNRELQITVHDVHTNFVCPTEQILFGLRNGLGSMELITSFCLLL